MIAEGSLVRTLFDGTLGRVFDVRDYGVEVWVHQLGPPDQAGRTFYTYYDQLEEITVLDILAAPPDWWNDDIEL